MKVYSHHRCNRDHRTSRTFLQCAFPSAAWVAGSGPFAVICWCRPITITLWRTEEAAGKSLDIVTATGCGSRCTGRHEIVRVAQ